MRSSLAVLPLDGATASHLARALEAHRRWCRDNGASMPTALDDLALLASNGHDRTSARRGAGLGDDDRVPAPPLVLTFAEAGRRLRVSDRTVRRLVADGALRAVTVASRRRIHADDLVAYAEALRGRSPARGEVPRGKP